MCMPPGVLRMCMCLVVEFKTYFFIGSSSTAAFCPYTIQAHRYTCTTLDCLHHGMSVCVQVSVSTLYCVWKNAQVVCMYSLRIYMI